MVQCTIALRFLERKLVSSCLPKIFSAGCAATGDALCRCAIRTSLVFRETKWGSIVCVRGNLSVTQKFPGDAQAQDDVRKAFLPRHMTLLPGGGSLCARDCPRAWRCWSLIK